MRTQMPVRANVRESFRRLGCRRAMPSCHAVPEHLSGVHRQSMIARSARRLAFAEESSLCPIPVPPCNHERHHTSAISCRISAPRP
jgi:hypothetical protein